MMESLVSNKYANLNTAHAALFGLPHNNIRHSNQIQLASVQIKCDGKTHISPIM